MLRRTLLMGQGAFRKTSTALICAAGLGAAGCAGNHLDLSSRLPWSARGADARIAEERPARTQVGEDAEEERGGRVFSAFVDRLPGRKAESRDPFLEQSVASASQRAAASGDFSAVQPVRPRTPVHAAARTSAPPVTQGRSDEELWRMFNDDAGAARVASAAPARAPQSTPAPAPQRSVAARTPAPGAATVSQSTAPRRQVVRPPASASAAQTSAPSTAQAGQSSAGPRPMPKLVAESAPAPRQPAPQGRPRVHSPAPQASGPVARQQEAEQRLAKLMAEARQFQAQGALFDAYRTAVVAEQFAERAHLVFAPRQQQPSDLVRELEAQMQAQRAAALPVADARTAAPPATTPPAAVRQPEPVRTVTVTRSRPADPFADDHAAAVAQPWKGATPAPPKTEVAEGREPFSTNFPPLHEWRGVRANSPVALTVSNSRAQADSEAPLPEFPVKQAVATEVPAPSEQRQGPLLARVEADRRQMLQHNQGTSLFGSGPQRGAARSPTDVRRAKEPAQSAPPPADAAPRGVEVAGPTLAKPASSRGSLVWWTLGLLALLTGGIALRSRGSAHDD